MTDEEFMNQFKIKEEHIVEGITADYVWYNAEILTQKMSSWQNEFKRVVEVMENRHKEHLEIIRQLMAENHELKPYGYTGLTPWQTRWGIINGFIKAIPSAKTPCS